MNVDPPVTLVLLSTLLIQSYGIEVATAQISPDLTLQSEATTVEQMSDGMTSTFVITGGAARGSNLFHSFEQFSVEAGDTAVFANVDSIENIFGRVTGGDFSSLDGTIQANGTANLFLLNPAGIIFGPDARLELGGSFVATTAEGAKFDNQFLYSATTPEQPPLLTVSTPVGLAFGTSSGDIQLLGQAANSPSALSVAEGQTLGLVAGNVSLTAKQLLAPSGRLVIGAVGESFELPLTFGAMGVDVDFSGVSRLGDIQISDQSILNVSGVAGGAIELQGQEIILTEESALISDTLGARDGGQIEIMADRLQLQDSSFIGAAALGSGSGSEIRVTATEEIALIGTGIINFKRLQTTTLNGTRQVTNRQIGGFFTTTTGAGRTGDINVNAPTILLDNGVAISAESLGPGDSGDISLIASERLEVIGSGAFTNSLVSGVTLIAPGGIPTGLSTIGFPAGEAGDILVDTTTLILRDGAAISAATLSDRNSGNISINASDSIVLRGFFDPIPFPNAISNTTIGGNGDAGDIQIQTGRLSLQDGSEIFSNSGTPAFQGVIPLGGAAGNISIRATEAIEVLGSVAPSSFLGAALAQAVPSNIESVTFSEAPAGAIQLETPRLVVQDGGRITSATFGVGAGGSIEVTADQVLVSGTGGRSNELISGIFSNSGVSPQDGILSGGQFSIDPTGLFSATGSSGVVQINTSGLAIQDSAEISVTNFGPELAGDLSITADTVRLMNQAGLTAITAGGQGGNIALDVQDSLLLSMDSLISAQAGGAGNGGNISIGADFIVSARDGSNDIIANAIAGQGGNITLTANGILGLEVREQLTPFSDINASSEVGIDGTVTINSPDVDVDSAPVELASDFVAPDLAQGCLAAQSSSPGSFVQTGRGGLPINPAAPLTADGLWQDNTTVQTSLTSTHQANNLTRHFISPQQQRSKPAEAQTWTITSSGKVQLIAPRALGQLLPRCSVH